MKLKTSKAIIEDLRKVRGLLLRIKDRLVNLDLGAEHQLVTDAMNIIMRTDQTILRSMCIINDNLRYLTLDEIYSADASLREISIEKMHSALCMTGMVELNSPIDIEIFFIEHHWPLKHAEEDEPLQTSLYDMDYFHVFMVVYALSYKKAKNHKIAHELEKSK